MFELTSKIQTLLTLNDAFLDASNNYRQTDIDTITQQISEIACTLTIEERYYCFLINFTKYTNITLEEADEGLAEHFGDDIEDKLAGAYEMIEQLEKIDDSAILDIHPTLQ